MNEPLTDEELATVESEYNSTGKHPDALVMRLLAEVRRERSRCDSCYGAGTLVADGDEYNYRRCDGEGFMK